MMDIKLYLQESSLVQSPKTQKVLDLLLANPDGLTRCCMREKLIEDGVDIGQVAAKIRELRGAGVNIPKVKKVKCLVHGQTDTKDQIVKPYITGNAYARANYSPKEVSLMRDTLGNADNFTLIRTTTLLEIDHRVPVVRRATTTSMSETKVDISNPEDITNEFQMLSRDSNLYKSRMCERCVNTGIKPEVFIGIPIPKSIGGGLPYSDANSCDSCPFAYPEKFRASLSHI